MCRMDNPRKVKIVLYDVADVHFTAWNHGELPQWLAEWLIKQPNLNDTLRYKIEVYTDNGEPPIMTTFLRAGYPIPVEVHRILTEAGF